MLLRSWLHPRYLKPDVQQQLRTTFRRSAPFRHLELPNFLLEEKAIALLKAVAKEKFCRKETDLFSFSQSNNLAATKQKTIQVFLQLLGSEEFAAFMQNITGFSIKPYVIDSFTSLYQNTDYLLPHDDEVEGRKVAWMVYLSTLRHGDGGTLNLYSSQRRLPTAVAKKLLPKFNTFAFFEVTPVSFHEVEEVVKDRQRIAVTGWFRD